MMYFVYLDGDHIGRVESCDPITIGEELWLPTDQCHQLFKVDGVRNHTTGKNPFSCGVTFKDLSVSKI